MKHGQSGSGRAILLAVIAIIGIIVLISFAANISGILKIIAWAGVAATFVLSGIFYNLDKKNKQELEKMRQRDMQERSKNRRDQKLRQEKNIEQAREKLAIEEERRAEKRGKIKQKIVEQATVTWSGRVDEAKEQEDVVRQIISKTDFLPIRTAAGEVAVEWNEAGVLAQWTMQQVEMFARLPAAKKEAREEAQDAIIEAIKLKESGAHWSFEKGKELAEKKERARLEIQTEEDRTDNMRMTLDNADLKWKTSERRIGRLNQELQKHIARYTKLK